MIFVVLCRLKYTVEHVKLKMQRRIKNRYELRVKFDTNKKNWFSMQNKNYWKENELGFQVD